MTRVVSWFSAGAASAVATMLAIKERPEDTVVANIDTGSEHPDNVRFVNECERWFDRPVERLKSTKYADTWQVWEERRFLVGPDGAPCTGELKKAVRFGFERPDDLQVFGYTAEETRRAARFRLQNPGVDLWCPLIDASMTKADCLGLIDSAGIEIPVMYQLGFLNNNCIGCPKGGMGYWNHVRRHFPEVFDRMAVLEREIGHAVCAGESKIDGKRVNHPVWLDELDPNRGDMHSEPNIDCGLVCAAVAADLEAT